MDPRSTWPGRPHLELDHGAWWWIDGPVPPGAAAITLGRLVIIRGGAAGDARLRRHELVHVDQWREQGAIGFLVRYLGTYVAWRARGWGHQAAYRRIPAEIEAEWVARRAVPL